MNRIYLPILTFWTHHYYYDILVSSHHMISSKIYYFFAGCGAKHPINVENCKKAMLMRIEHENKDNINNYSNKEWRLAVLVVMYLQNIHGSNV